MGSSGGNSERFLRHLSLSDGGTSIGSRRGSRRWFRKKARARGHRRGGGFCRMEVAVAGRKRVMVVVD